MFQHLFYACGHTENARHWLILWSTDPVDEQTAIAMAKQEWGKHASTAMIAIDSWTIHSAPTQEDSYVSIN